MLHSLACSLPRAGHTASLRNLSIQAQPGRPECTPHHTTPHHAMGYHPQHLTDDTRVKEYVYTMCGMFIQVRPVAGMSSLTRYASRHLACMSRTVGNRCCSLGYQVCGLLLKKSMQMNPRGLGTDTTLGRSALSLMPCSRRLVQV